VDYKGETRKIGVITLPTFYIDFEALQRRDPNYRSSTRDIRDLLIELQKEDISGVVVDLRRNGGGSLSEANSLAGLFIRRGATVQVRDADGNNMVQGDNNEEVVYDGPLAVLVNRLSASASEIFAGAIQDYQRGVVVGGQTFGKGTVQELIPMNEGQIKITRAKFYRISGESTQHRGIEPDITFPDLYDMAEDIGESALPNALPWDTIEPTFYRPWGNLRQYLPDLQARHEARATINPDFNYVRAQIDRALENRERNLLTLQEEKLLAERKADDEWLLQTENARRVAKGLEPYADIDALEGGASEGDNELALLRDGLDTTRVEREDDGADTAAGADEELAEEDAAEEEVDEPDPYLVESGRILLDLRELQQTDPLSLAIQRTQ
jgi:carboxyl-terminal processing protease